MAEEEGGFGGWLSGLLGGGSSAPAEGQTPDSMSMLSDADRKRLMYGTLGQLGATLLAAGQKQMPAQRAQYLAQLGNVGGNMQSEMFKIAQTNLMRQQLAEKSRVLSENKSLDEWVKSPENLKSLGLTPEAARILGRDGLRQYAIKQFGKTPLERLTQEELLRIAGGSPAPSGTPVSAPQAPAPIEGGEAPAAVAPGMPPQASSAAASQSMAERIARNPIIQLGDPQRAAASATLVEKLREPGAVAEAQALAKARAERISAQPNVELSLVTRREQTQRVGQLINDALSKVSNTSAGIGGKVFSGVPQTDAYNLGRDIEAIKANIGFDELQKMRDASPTGGALGQVAVQELNYLQSVLGSLDQFQDPKIVRARLGEVKTILEKYQGIRESAYERDYGVKFSPERLTRERQQAGASPAQEAAPARPASAPASIPPNAIEFLRKNPNLRKQFDEKYGAGASDSVLGK